MTEKNTGGPAFPAHTIAMYEGMTLRDYFAAKAMVGELTAQCQETGHYGDLDALAVQSYRIADAMLKAREA